MGIRGEKEERRMDAWGIQGEKEERMDAVGLEGVMEEGERKMGSDDWWREAGWSVTRCQKTTSHQHRREEPSRTSKEREQEAF